jgi:CHAD domain-containing protein
MLPLCKYLDDLVDDLARLTPAALEKFDEQAIHKARVATRRLKAAIELLEPVLDKSHVKPFARIGKKLRHRLGPLRDIDVMLAHLEKIKPTSPHADAADWLAQRLTAERDRAREKSRGKSSSGKVLSQLGTWKTLREDVIAAEEAIPCLLAESLHLQLDRFAEQASDVKNAHQLRIAGKALRYTVEFAKANKHDLPAGVVRAFKSIQDSLGTWHDFVVLAECAMEESVAAELPLMDSGLQRRILNFTGFCLTRAQRSLDHFHKLWNERGPELNEAIRAAMPLTQSTASPPLKLPQTDPDPASSPPPQAAEVVDQASPPTA